MVVGSEALIFAADRTLWPSARSTRRSCARMERLMAFWNLEQDTRSAFAIDARTRQLDLAALAAIAVAPALFLLVLVPGPLFLPALSIVSFAVACIAALFAYFAKVDHRTPRAAVWDIAAIFTVIWIVAGTMSGPKRIFEFFDRITAAI
jgi:hypothetical protein